MKICIFVVVLAAYLHGLSTADIESSNDNSTVTSGSVSHPNKANASDETVGDAAEADDDVNEEADDNTPTSNRTFADSPTGGSNSTEPEDIEDIENSNSTLFEPETHNESNKTTKRHTYYVNTGYSQPLTLQQQQLAPPAAAQPDIYSYVDYRQSRRYADTIPGVEGRDYPIFASVPPTSFSCNGRAIGLYGDVEARCQVWHNCQLDGRKDSFLCPNGTLFNQQVLVCDWWHNVQCETTPSYYGLNAQLVQQGPIASQLYQHGYRQQINRYQDTTGNSGYYYNYQKPFYVQTTAYPTGYYFDSGRGVYSSSSGQAAGASVGSAAAAAGSSFVSTNNFNGGSSGGYYYRPSYQRVEENGRTTSGLGGYGYTVSSQHHAPGYVTMRYDIPGGQYASNAASAAAGGGFQYSYSTGQLPAGQSVPIATGSFSQANQASRYQYRQSQRLTSSGDPIDHPNYNEKSGYNYRPPQIPIPTPVRPIVPVAPVVTTSQVYSTQQQLVQQPKISVPLRPLPAVTPAYASIDHPNANEKSGYTSRTHVLSTQQQIVQPSTITVPLPAAKPVYAPIDHPNANEKSGYTSRTGSQTTNYAFSTYSANGNAHIPIAKQATVAGTSGGQLYSTYNRASESVHPNANEKSAYAQKPARQNINYAFSTYESGHGAAPAPVRPTVQATVVAAPAVQSTYSQTTHSRVSEAVHPNANEKSAYVQKPARQNINYAFSTYESGQGAAPAPVRPTVQATVVAAPAVQSTYSQTTHSRVSEAVHPNANEKSGYVRASANAQGGRQTTNYAFSSYDNGQNYQFSKIAAQPSQAVRQSTYTVSSYDQAEISHPNANQKSGYVSVVNPVVQVTQRPIVPVTYRPIVPVTHRPIVPVTRPTKIAHIDRDPIDHPNYREKSGYNPRTVPVGTVIPPDFPRPKIVAPPARVQVDCVGAAACPPSPAAVNVELAANVHQNFGERVESGPIRIVAGATGGGSVAASDRSAGAVEDGGYY